MIVGKDEQYNAKGGISFSLFLQLFLTFTSTLRWHSAHTHKQKCTTVSQFFIPYGNEYCCMYLKYSRISAYKPWSDPSHSLFLRAICTIKHKHGVTQTVTGRFIFEKLKGHSIWQYSIAYSHEMNHDRKKLTTNRAWPPRKSKGPLTFYIPDSLWTERKQEKERKRMLGKEKLADWKTQFKEFSSGV